MKMSLKLDDLIEKCEACDGTGKKKEAPRPSGGGGRTYGMIRPDLFTGDSSACERCNGSGRGAPTETGKAILEFIRLAQKRSLIQ
jgi:DnaJ-class molecular chaperone